jgi:hypothetical protein
LKLHFSGAILPVSRIPAAVKHSNDFDSIRVRPVEDAVRETADDCFSNVRERALINERRCRDSIEYLLDFGCEFDAEPGTLGFVLIKCLVKFELSFVAQDEAQAHRRALASARALMTSHGVTASGRAMLSAKRRSNSERCASERGAASISRATLSQMESATERRSSALSASNPSS